MLSQGNFFGGEFFGDGLGHGGFFGNIIVPTAGTPSPELFRGKREKEIEEARREFGVLPPKVQEAVEVVAEKRAEGKYVSARAGRAALQRELEARGVSYEKAYYEALAKYGEIERLRKEAEEALRVRTEVDTTALLLIAGSV